VLAPLRLVRGGRFDEAALRARARAGPTRRRNPDDNVADLEAHGGREPRGRGGCSRARSPSRGARRWRAHHARAPGGGGPKVRARDRALPDGEHAFADRSTTARPVAVTLRVAASA
jgi:hypothetical protein